jgi:serine/threonine protein kinase
MKEGLLKQVYLEAELMKKLNSDYIIKFYDFFENENFFFLILEYCEDGSLLDIINSYQINRKMAIQILLQILIGIK